MSRVSYCAYRKRQARGRYVWGVLRQEGRKQKFSVGEGEKARRKAVRLAKRHIVFRMMRIFPSLVFYP